MGNVIAIIVILFIVVTIYALLAFLSDKRGHCVDAKNQICGTREGGCCNSR